MSYIAIPVVIICSLPFGIFIVSAKITLPSDTEPGYPGF
jgi:hypothetical protein